MGKSLKSPSPIYSTSEDDLPPPSSGCVSYSVFGALQALGAKYSNGEEAAIHIIGHTTAPLALASRFPKHTSFPFCDNQK